ncbi:MAG TPA: formimidoylglutamate deiminase [Propionicimonas sp.]
MREQLWCRTAWLPDGPHEQVRLRIERGLITKVETGAMPVPGDTLMTGLVLPGFANVHSHAFHRALRGHTHAGGGDFWTWRDQMFRLAAALDPSTCYELARAVYAEMVLAGVTAVGEFHYVHHPADGGRYDDPNAMADALRSAARDAGLRLTLLDTCYLAGGMGRPVEGVQERFSDGDAERWAERVSRLTDDAGFQVGAAVHSVRAVPRDQLATVVDWARERGAPLHAHLSEQPAENDACVEAFGLTPTELLDECGFLAPASTVVHAVHLTQGDVGRLGGSGTSSCLCPTTERDLADGIAPAGALRDAGSPLCLGSDQHATVDLLAEAQALEMDERLLTGRRGTFDPSALVQALTVDGHRALGRPAAGRIAVGAPADLVAVRTDTVRTAGADIAQLVMVAAAGDVDTVMVSGEVVVGGGEHRLGDVAELLGTAVSRIRRQAWG